MGLWYLSPCRAAKAHASLCKCTDYPEPSLLTNTIKEVDDDSN